MSGILFAPSGLLDLGSSTNRTRVKVGCHGNLGDTNGMPVHFGNVTGMHVSESEALLIMSDMTNDICMAGIIWDRFIHYTSSHLNVAVLHALCHQHCLQNTWAMMTRDDHDYIVQVCPPLHQASERQPG